MQIFNYELGPLGVNSFLIVPENSDAILIDAPEDSFDTIGRKLVQLEKKLGAVMLTHAHWDHIWDAHKFQQSGVKIYVHPDGKKFLEDANFQRDFLFAPPELKPVKIDVNFYDGQILEFGDCKIEVRETAGHCAGSVSFVVEKEKLAFVGDLLFAGSVGRTDLATGNFAQLEKSIKEKIFTLPNDFKILCGHGGFTSVGEEKTSNPYIH